MSSDSSDMGVGSSARGSRYGLMKVRAGVYRHRSGRLIVRTEDVYEGPRGGGIDGWEEAEWSDKYGLCVGGYCVYPTLREAVTDLDRRARS